jgi:hypothetical protein
VNARKWSSLESLTADSSFPEDETDRRTINSWIRTSGAFDAVIGFDATWGDPANPSQIIDALQAGDHAQALTTMLRGRLRNRPGSRSESAVNTRSVPRTVNAAAAEAVLSIGVE